MHAVTHVGARPTPSYRETATTLLRHGPLGIAVPATNSSAKGWTQPVVRLSDLSDAERIALGGRARDDAAYRAPLALWRCQNVCCGHWTTDPFRLPGARELCRFCWTPRPTDTPED